MVEMELKYRVLNALSQTDGYVSGGEMAARFNVSRTLVWKAVNQLRRDGHAISTVNKLGYRLEIQSDIINPHVIEDYLEKSFATQNKSRRSGLNRLTRLTRQTSISKDSQTRGRAKSRLRLPTGRRREKDATEKAFFPPQAADFT